MLCRCGHDKDWHAEGGAADCEHSAECRCVAFGDARMEEAQKCLYAAATLAHASGKFKTAMTFEEARLGLIEYEVECRKASVPDALAGCEQPTESGRSSLFPSHRRNYERST